MSGKIEFKDQKEVKSVIELDPSIYFLTDVKIDFTLVALKRHPIMSCGNKYPSACELLDAQKDPNVKKSIEKGTQITLY